MYPHILAVKLRPFEDILVVLSPLQSLLNTEIKDDITFNMFTEREHFHPFLCHRNDGIFFRESVLAGRMLNSFNLLYAWVEKLFIVHVIIFTQQLCENLSCPVCPCRNRASEVLTSSGKGINNSITLRVLISRMERTHEDGTASCITFPYPTMVYLYISSSLTHYHPPTEIHTHLNFWCLVIKKL